MYPNSEEERKESFFTRMRAGGITDEKLIGDLYDTLKAAGIDTEKQGAGAFGSSEEKIREFLADVRLGRVRLDRTLFMGRISWTENNDDKKGRGR